MRSQPIRSRPMRGKRPRYIGGRTSIGSRPRANECRLRRALARAARPQGTFAGCTSSCDGYPPDRHRAHGARGARASIEHDPASCRRFECAAGGVVGRAGEGPAQNARFIAGRSRLKKPRRPGPARIAYRCLTVCSSGTTGLAGLIVIDAHLPPRVVTPALLPGREGESRNFATSWNLLSARPAHGHAYFPFMLGPE